jgi:glycosyltransferase involved in cell wall biosynthesis
MGEMISRSADMSNQNRKINVLLANDHLGWNGTTMHGVGRYFLYIIPIFDRSRFNIVPCILRKEDALNKVFAENGIRIRFLGRGKFDPLTLLDFLKIIEEEQIDVMHLQAYGATTFGRIASAITGVPAIVHSRDADPHYPWYQVVPDYVLARFTEKAIAVSRYTKDFSIRKRKIPADKTIVMYNPVPLSRFQPLKDDEKSRVRESLGIPADATVIGTVTRLYDVKGNEFLIRAAEQVLAEFPRAFFVIAGEGPLREDLEDLSRGLGIGGRVLFTGFYEDVPRLLSIFDIGVFPSLSEGCGTALLEAMVMGKAIVASAIGGPGELLVDKGTGRLVPAADASALSRAVLYLIRHPAEAERLARAAAEEGRKFDLYGYVKRLQDVYHQVALAKRSRHKN